MKRIGWFALVMLVAGSVGMAVVVEWSQEKMEMP